jgi:tRNA-uridine 2-sulfurtransferase
MKKHTIVIGMSGGVDSSVSALLLKEQGHNVIGLFMKNWEEADSQGVCLSSSDFADVAQVCSQIKIPYYSVNFVKEYRDSVFQQFLSDCRAGLTPNPDVLCNREIKLKVLLQKAIELGADFLATGHYCQKEEPSLLLKGKDPDKDQSYFLHAIDGEALKRVLFPIGHLKKSEVRAIARRANLSTSEKKDSTGICFIGERNFKRFLGQFLGFQSGPLLNLDGQEVGRHDGFAYYTIGQRKGIGLGGEGEAWYVVGKDPGRNAVFVARGGQHPALFSDELIARDLTWINEAPPLPSRLFSKIRYRQKDTPCELFPHEKGLRVRFDHPQRAVTPGQSIVFYEGDVCLGGGVIEKAAQRIETVA